MGNPNGITQDHGIWPLENEITINLTQNLTKNFTLSDDMVFNDAHKLSIVVYSILFIVSSIGNLTVLYFLIQRRRKSPARIDAMLMHLAIADLLVSFFF